MELVLYSYNGNNLTVNKTLNDGLSVNGNLRQSASNETLSIELETTFENFNYNYCYCVELNRYYFIESFYLDITRLYTVNLRIDYLKSFQDEILKSECEIVECENNYASDFIRYDSNTKEKITVFNGNNIFNSDTSIVLVASKGNTISTSSE